MLNQSQWYVCRMPGNASIATNHWGHSSTDDQNLQDLVAQDQHRVMPAQSRKGIKGY